MKKRIRLIALDMDGTTFNSRKEITNRTRRTIAEAVERGIQVFPATGRPKSYLPQEIMSIPGVHYASTSNGASIIDMNKEAPLYEDLIPAERMPDIIRRIKDLPVIIELFYKGACYCDRSTLPVIEQILQERPSVQNGQAPEIYEDGIFDRLLQDPFPVEKVHLIFSDLKIRKEIMDFYQKENILDVTSAFAENLELTSKTATKSNALLRLAGILGISQEETMAIGDSFNDLDMLEAAGTSVAMGNAEPEIKETADLITKTNDEDGVAWAIEKYAF
ncbi:MAG TPA: Cof-type HAD-IIB family hydrolase [Candidatus Anaerostipes avicola]|uniref:Cof-type HAD-IIB family hydrolase n=1 Tax=Anaerostipes TaxID=207244 RepID=UPI001F8B4200|nr:MULTISPECIES: Cof-type HAD-IIB family hydrolase [Anaerostipes]HJC83072.1 Cof-type HAD-IIB family hydrolase [Candidatus Anaerostipes avicola]